MNMPLPPHPLQIVELPMLRVVGRLLYHVKSYHESFAHNKQLLKNI